MIIDAHAHLGVFQKFRLENDADSLVAVMDRFGIDLACVSSLKGILYDFIEGNREVFKAMKKYPNRILGYAYINPWYGEEGLKELETCIKRFGMIGLKLHPDYSDCPVDSLEALKIIEGAVRLRVPILLHSYDGGLQVGNVAERFPEAKIIMAHMGGVWRKSLHIAKKHENIIAETCSSVFDPGMIEEFVKVIGAERVVFGTDVPLLDAGCMMAKVKASKISEEDKRLILGGNMERILKIKEAPKK